MWSILRRNIGNLNDYDPNRFEAVMRDIGATIRVSFPGASGVLLGILTVSSGPLSAPAAQTAVDPEQRFRCAGTGYTVLRDDGYTGHEVNAVGLPPLIPRRLKEKSCTTAVVCTEYYTASAPNLRRIWYSEVRRCCEVLK
jgi:hypothetical protein